MRHSGKKVIKKIAKQQGTTVHAVRQDIQNAIDAARKRTDIVSSEFWKNIKQDITPEAFIELMASKIDTKK